MNKKILSILIIALTWSMSVANAGYNPVSRNLCSLATLPFDALKTATTGTTANQYFNNLDSTCSNFVTYPNAYSPQPPNKTDNPLKTIAIGKNVPATKHIHTYYNDSFEDNYYYGAFMDRFEITLESDGYNSIDINNITCGTPIPTGYNEANLAPINDCDGTISDLWGGTTVSKKPVGNNVVVTWDFASVAKDGKYTGRPKIFGNNGSNFDGMDLTDQNNRKLKFYVNLPSKDKDQIWSATTTSRALIAHLGIKKTNYPNNNFAGCSNGDINSTASGWCYLPAPNQYSTETVFTTANHIFHWFPIGSVATVWQEPSPEVKPNICEDLKLNPLQKLTDAQVKEYTGSIENGPIYRLSLKSLKFSDTFFPGNAQVTWKNEDPNGKFWDEGFFGGLAPLSGQEVSRSINAFDLSKNQIWYSGKGPVSARITGLPAEQIGPSCNDSIQIPVEETECKEILIDHNDKIYTGTVSTFKAHSIDTKDKNFNGKITYTVDAGYGEFYSKKPTGIPENPSKMVYQATPVSAIAPLPGGILLNPNGEISITPNVLIGNTYDATIKNTYNTIFGLATGDFNLNTLPNYINLNLIDQNNWENFDMTAPPINPIPMDISPIDPSPLSSLFLADVFNLPTLEDLTKPGLIAPDFINPQSFFETITVDADTTVYFVAKKPGKNVIHVKTQGTTVKDCGRDFDIEPKPAQICLDLGFIATPVSPWIVGQTGSININPKDTDGKSLPTSTKIKLTTTAGGKFTTDTNLKGFIDLNGSATNNQFPIQFQNSDKEGIVTVEIDPTDPAYSAICKGTVEVKKPTEEELVCKNLTLKLTEVGIETPLTELKDNKLYYVQGVATYSKTHTNTITYSMDSAYGAFLTTNINSYDNFSLILQSAQSAKIITTKSTLDDILNYFNYPSSVSTLVKQQGEGVTLITFSKIPGSATPLHVSETVITNPDCKKDVPISPEATPTDNIECTNLTLTNPSSPWIVGEDDDTQPFQIDVDTNPAGKEQDLQYKWTIIGEGKWKSESKLIRTLTDFDEDTEVEVYEINNQSNCSDYIQAQKEKEDRKPTIEKVVFPSSNIKDYNDFINISSKIPYLTYMIVFHPGDADDAQISDLELKDGKIKAKGTLGGTLDFNGGISINIIKKGQNINIYKSPQYKSDNYRTYNYSDKNFTEENSSNYGCEPNSVDICYEGNIDDAVKNFINGKEPIKFKNLDKLGTDGAIIIKYQMTNKTAINEDVCKRLTKAQGCGEEFNNTAQFIAQKEGKTPDYKGKDSAKTIVICPYILTRSGGDVFFHDVVDTGIDVAQCSEVKGHTGPGVTPTPVKKGKVTSTGAGDLPTGITLDVPSHDVCRYSNLDSNVKGYDDVLKHFSSTICELRADVSEKWQEDNINKSIAANITRIARWGDNLTSKTVDFSSINAATNKQSGVFVHTGDLTINNGIPDVTGVPAAQTYIVRNGNLKITSDIIYGETKYIDPKNIPSYAFIVIDGNIEIASTVKHIDGILMAVNLDGKGEDGKVMSNSISEELLTINGNLIGNVYDLFSKRIGVGDPAKDEGSVTIRYDSRILLNTPPGISELINIQQAIVPN